MIIQQSKYIIHILLLVLFLMFIIITCSLVLEPLILSFIWAGTIVISTWPLLLKLQKILFNYRSIAILVMILLIFLILIIPIIVLINSILDIIITLIKLITNKKEIISNFIWLNNIPIIGNKLYISWHNILEMSNNTIIEKTRPYIISTTTWFINKAAYIGYFLMNFIIMLIFSIILYWNGEIIAKNTRLFAIKLAGKNGCIIIKLVIQAIRAVALGIVIASVIQAILGGIGLAISGIPYCTVFTILMILTCLVQLGPLIVLIPAIIWLYWNGSTHWGTMLVIWSCIICIIDNIIRPILIQMRANLPLIPLVSGIIGGIISFGIIGLFVGPVLLVVLWKLFHTWIEEYSSSKSSRNPYIKPHSMSNNLKYQKKSNFNN